MYGNERETGQEKRGVEGGGYRLTSSVLGGAGLHWCSTPLSPPTSTLTWGKLPDISMGPHHRKRFGEGCDSPPKEPLQPL